MITATLSQRLIDDDQAEQLAHAETYAAMLAKAANGTLDDTDTVRLRASMRFLRIEPPTLETDVSLVQRFDRAIAREPSADDIAKADSEYRASRRRADEVETENRKRIHAAHLKVSRLHAPLAGKMDAERIAERREAMANVDRTRTENKATLDAAKADMRDRLSKLNTLRSRKAEAARMRTDMAQNPRLSLGHKPGRTYRFANMPSQRAGRA